MKDINLIKNKKITILLSDIEKKAKHIFGNNLCNIILYGSYARGNESNESDIDILILIDTEEKELLKYKDEIVDIMTDLSLENDILVSIIEETKQRYDDFLDYLPFYKNIDMEGIKIYERKAA